MHATDMDCLLETEGEMGRQLRDEGITEGYLFPLSFIFFESGIYIEFCFDSIDL